MGIPFSYSRHKKSLFQPLIHKLELKINSWHQKYLSKAGRMIIIQSIPLHIMSCIKLLNIADKMDQLFKNFYWRGTQTDSNIHWVDWDTVCNRKFESGLGLRKMGLLNQVLLAKQCWILTISPTSIMARLLKDLYHPHSNIIDSKISHKTSPYWR